MKKRRGITLKNMARGDVVRTIDFKEPDALSGQKTGVVISLDGKTVNGDEVIAAVEHGETTHVFIGGSREGIVSMLESLMNVIGRKDENIVREAVMRHVMGLGEEKNGSDSGLN